MGKKWELRDKKKLLVVLISAEVVLGIALLCFSVIIDKALLIFMAIFLVMAAIPVWFVLKESVMCFDVHGFSKYSILGDKYAVSWKSITKAEYRSVSRGAADKKTLVEYIAVYTDEFYRVPDLLENTENRRPRPNEAKKIFGRYESETFIDYLEFHRPDLKITKGGR